jgi:hypothetical protein
MRHLLDRRPVKVSPAEDQHAVGEFGSALCVPEMVLTTVDLPLQLTCRFTVRASPA